MGRLGRFKNKNNTLRPNRGRPERRSMPQLARGGGAARVSAPPASGNAKALEPPDRENVSSSSSPDKRCGEGSQRLSTADAYDASACKPAAATEHKHVLRRTHRIPRDATKLTSPQIVTGRYVPTLPPRPLWRLLGGLSLSLSPVPAHVAIPSAIPSTCHAHPARGDPEGEHSSREAHKSKVALPEQGALLISQGQTR